MSSGSSIPTLILPSLIPPPPPLPLSVPSVPSVPPPGRTFSAIGPIDVDILEMIIPYSLILQKGPDYTSSTDPLTELTLSNALDIINTKLEKFDLIWEPALLEMINKNSKSITRDYLNRTLAMRSVIQGISTHIDNWIVKDEDEDDDDDADADYDSYGIVIVDLLNIMLAIPDYFGVDRKNYKTIFEILQKILFKYIDNNTVVCRFIICIQNHLLDNPNFIAFIRELRTKLNSKCRFRYPSDAILILPAPNRASGDDMLALLAYTRIALRIEKTGTRSGLVYTLLTNDYYGDFKSRFLKGNKNLQNFNEYLNTYYKTSGGPIRGSSRSRPSSSGSSRSGPYSSGPYSSGPSRSGPYSSGSSSSGPYSSGPYSSGPSSSGPYSSGPYSSGPYSSGSSRSGSYRSGSSRSGSYRGGGYGGTIKNNKLLKHNYHKKTRKMTIKASHKNRKTTIKAYKKHITYKKHRIHKKI